MVSWPHAEVCRKTKRKVLLAVRISVIVLCLIAVRCNGNYFKGPSDTTVTEGSRATLHCQTSSSNGVWWRYSDKDIFYANTISHDYKDSHESKVNVSNGIYSYKLIIRNASSHPGQYTCIDDDGEGDRGSAWLTVTANAMETPSNPPAGDNTVKTVAVAVAVAVISFIVVIVLVIFYKRRQKSNRRREERRLLDNDRSNQLDGAEHRDEQEVNTGRSEDPNKISTDGEHTREQEYKRIEGHIPSTDKTQEPPTEAATTGSNMASNSQTASSVSSPIPCSSSPAGEEEGKDETEGQDDESKKLLGEGAYFDENIPLVKRRIMQFSEHHQDPAEVGKPKAAATDSCMASNSQTASSVSSPPQLNIMLSGPVAKSRLTKVSDTSALSPREREESGNDNDKATESKNPIERTNKTDNTRTDLLKSEAQKDELPKTESTLETIVEQKEDVPKKEELVSPGKQAPVTAKKPAIPEKPTIAGNLTNEQTENTAKNVESVPTVPEQASGTAMKPQIARKPTITGNSTNEGTENTAKNVKLIPTANDEQAGSDKTIDD